MRRLASGRVACFLVVALALATPSFATNILVNPGFETGDFTGWTLGGLAANGVAVYGTPVAAYYPGFVDVLSGQYAAYGVVRGYCCTTPEPIILSQTLSVAPYQTLNIGFSARNWSSSSVGAEVGDAPNKIEIYVNGAPILGDSGYFLFANGAGWYNFAGTFANGAATTIAVDFRFLASGTGNFPASLDDFYVEGTSSVPEPCSTLLLLGIGIGTSALAARRGRK